MKYWGYLALKLLLAVLVITGTQSFLSFMLPTSARLLHSRVDPFTHDLTYTSAMMLHYLFSMGLLYLVFWDQRYRCRTCLRRLRMPVNRGSWPNMFLIGQPRMEYICLYGHGTLKVPDVDLTGSKRPNWKANEDMWTELESLQDTRK